MSETMNEAGRRGTTGFWIFVKVLGALHRWLYRASGGRLGRTFFGSPVLLLTTTGRKTDRPRTWPLGYLQEGDQIVVIASNGGQPNHPAWYLNLRADPRVTVQLRDRLHPMTAAAAEGDKRELLWSRAVREYPAFEGYQRKTTRQLPVVILRPATAAWR